MIEQVFRVLTNRTKWIAGLTALFGLCSTRQKTTRAGWDPQIRRRRVDRAAFEAKVETWRRRGAAIGRNTRIIGTIDSVNPHLIRIGENCVIGSHAAVLAHGPTRSAATSIGNNVFIGFGAVILPGVSVAENCIIGAGAVVTRDLPPNSICVGNPARVLRQRDSTELAEYVESMEKGWAIGAVDPEVEVPQDQPIGSVK